MKPILWQNIEYFVVCIENCIESEIENGHLGPEWLYKYQLFTPFFFNIFLMWTSFKVFLLNFYSISFVLWFGFWLWGIWDLSSLIRNQTCTPYIGRWSLNHQGSSSFSPFWWCGSLKRTSWYCRSLAWEKRKMQSKVSTRSIRLSHHRRTCIFLSSFSDFIRGCQSDTSLCSLPRVC